MIISELKFLLKNVKENIKKITNESCLVDYLENYKNNIHLNKIHNIVRDVVDCKMIGLENDKKLTDFMNNINDIEYLDLIEDNPSFSVGVFFIPKNQVMQLHDHRNMLVFSKIIQGEAQINSYDKISHKDLEENKFEVQLIENKILKSGEMNILTPLNKNIHEIIAVQPVALFDTLIPDYPNPNACNYFKKSIIGNKMYLSKL